MYSTEKFIAANALLCGVMLSVICGRLAWIGVAEWRLLLGYWLSSVCLCYAVFGPLYAEFFNGLTGCLALSALCPAAVFYLVRCIMPVEYYLFSGVAVWLAVYQWLSNASTKYAEEGEDNVP